MTCEGSSNIPVRMRAWLRDKEATSHTEMQIGEVDVPIAGEGELLVQVKAVSLNPVDYKLAAWGHPAWTFPHIGGLDVAGVVVAVGPATSGWAPGDRVFFHGDLRRNGGFAEFVVTVAHTLVKLPDAVSFVAGAAIPCAGFTAYQAIHDRLHLKSGQTVLITGASGGVGGWCLQLAKQIGATVIATYSSSPDPEVELAKVHRLKQLGADYLVDYSRDSVVDTVLALTNGRGVDAAVDNVSPTSAETCMKVLTYAGGVAAVGGRPTQWPTQPFTISPSVHEISLGAAYAWGTREHQHHMSVIGDILVQSVQAGSLDPMITKVLPFEDLVSGLSELASMHSQGKIVVSFEQ